ncbi:MAG: hypothetical protein IPJ78_04765 [Gemmatimonadetes bacterium]|nr:hypothetical protein [Gemmatimonadota bacterium]
MSERTRAADERASELQAALAAAGAERAALTPSGGPTPAPPSPTLEAQLTAPEPWSRVLWRAAKSWVIGSVTMYSLMRLMGESDITPARAAFVGAWPAIITIFGRRTGNMLPATPALIMGGVTLGGAALIGATTIVTGEWRGDALGFTAMGAFLGGVLLWMGLRARRAERAHLAREHAVAPVIVSRAELAARIERLQTEQAPDGRKMLTRLLIGCGVLMGVLAFPYVRVFGAEPPEVAAIALFFGSWGALGLTIRNATRRGREVAATHGLVCSACDQPYFGTFANMRLQKNLAEIGLCPQCGARIITEE